MHAVFFMSETIRVDGLEDQIIHVFEDESSADEFVFVKMIEAGLISVENGKIFVDGDLFEMKEIAIQAVQIRMSGLEFFHVYKAIDHRTVTVEHEPGEA